MYESGQQANCFSLQNLNTTKETCKMCTCYITSPNKTIHEINFDPKQIGQVVLDKVLGVHGIIEVDFFGLQYSGPKKEELWLNLRNRVCDQLNGSSELYQLKLKVKYFVQPSFIQQPATKELFYAQAKEAISKGQISLSEPHCDDCKLSRLVAAVTQADHGDITSNSYQLNTYTDVLKCLYPDCSPSQDLIDKIQTEHSYLAGFSVARAMYEMLKLTSELPGYGVELHKVSTVESELNFGVGPEGLVLQNVKTKEERKINYAQISLATHNDKSVHIQLLDDAGEPTGTEECFRLTSRKAAVGLYRCITEMHSFYRCDTVCEDVQSQYCRDFRGTFVSIFNENSDLGKRFIFDIQRTSREAYDLVRRRLYKASSGLLGSPAHLVNPPSPCEEEREEEIEDIDNKSTCDNVIKIQPNKNNELQREIKSLKRRLEVLEDAYLCCICMYNKVCTVLCPCGHMTCDTCSERITVCPQCRCEVKQFQKVYHNFGCMSNSS